MRLPNIEILHMYITSGDVTRLDEVIKRHEENPELKALINNKYKNSNALDLALKKFETEKDSKSFNIVHILIKNGAKNSSGFTPQLETLKTLIKTDEIIDYNSDEEEEEEEDDHELEEEEEEKWNPLNTLEKNHSNKVKEKKTETNENEPYQSLVNKMNGYIQFSELENTRTLADLYNYYAEDFIKLGKKEQTDFFIAHLKFIINFHKKDESNDYLFLDFAIRIYPSLEPNSKKMFVLFINNMLNIETSKEITNILDQQGKRYCGFFSSSSNKQNSIYPAKFLNNHEKIIQSKALEIAKKLELKENQAKTSKQIKTNLEKNHQPSISIQPKTAVPEVPPIPPALKALILDTQYWKTKCFISIDGIKAMKKLIDTSEKIELKEFQKIVNERPEQGKIGLFHRKRNAYVEFLYQAIKNAKSWNDLNYENPYLKEVFNDRAQKGIGHKDYVR